MKHTKDKRLYIRITQGELVELQEIARKKGKSASEYARQAIENKIELDKFIAEQQKQNTYVNI